MVASRQAQARDRQSIWSVPGHLWPWYIVIFVLQYFFFLGLTIWDEVVTRGGSGAIAVTLEVQREMTAGILNMAASTYIILEGVMLAQWLKERDLRKQEEHIQKVREEGIELGREEGKEQGVEEANRNWHEWLRRRQAAERDGIAFDEPPPWEDQPKQD